MRSQPLHGKTVMITGAARGLGAGTARELVGRGANVALVGLEPGLLEELAEELGSRADWREADVTDAQAMAEAAQWAVERFGALDALVANAGVHVVGTVAEIEPADFERVIEVDLLGVWRSVRAALPHLVERRGYVLVISSVAAVVHLPLMAPYAASKAGAAAFAQALRCEVAEHGVDVGVAYLSFVDTDLVRDAFATPEAAEFIAAAPKAVFRSMPLQPVVKALAQAVERRARRVVRPRALWPLVYAPGLAEVAVRRGLMRIRARAARP